MLDKLSDQKNENLALPISKRTNCFDSLKALKDQHTNLRGILILEDDLVTPNLEMVVLTTFHTFLPRHSWHKLLYLSCKDWLRNTTATTGHTITCYSTEIIGALALISINKIIVLYTDSSILARVWFAFAFFYILYRWYSRLGRFFNATARYISTSAVIFWEKPKVQNKFCQVSVCNILVHFYQGLFGNMLRKENTLTHLWVAFVLEWFI